MQSFLASLRLVVATMLISVVAYSAVVLGIAQLLTPATANGSLIANAQGQVVGSKLIAQKFTEPRYFWPRPSAVDYNAAGAGGSNKSPTSTDLTERATGTVAAYGATAANPLPADLAAASGGGLDPHITEQSALYQVPRIAAARGIPAAGIDELVARYSFAPGGILAPDRLVNVLELNLALDQMAPAS
ncbi:MAG: Potassium-transporting ATPase [Devosia sp.]|uniref:K(+)-transporting ATPase subunit C n=1 Tax=Devosia sp. TaxID=1871048 RepID=UPI0026366AFE|nr:K(+)-transporting ATPase subunit C [Devosia sp.]MDB5540785.1 Potassium-transporting ATPase [Devosia sp.]